MMGLNELACALGFAMIFECLLPMIAPARWRRMLKSLSGLPDPVISKAAAAGVACGLALVWLFQSGMISF